ncbi:hypothetical protein SAMN06295967_103260 [Belliella buryatensis]|uniref:Uncharacterized protein n=1 Tax=Belliella buryatensis TaxID=1500549 RepID=A0A239BWU5_9BACT|nr:hypothetical protein [Belliella buryatensis]SNS11908.1 hypothetical protein SAMN06295967_103260 [Belliella buryatensis]
MKLKDIILLSLSAALVVIGTHLTITEGITLSYPVFMLAIAILFWYRYRKNEALIKDKEQEANKKIKKKK